MIAARTRIADAGGLFADPVLVEVMDVLSGEGEETRIAGGAVRDTLLGRDVNEVDLATTALPEETARRAAAAGFKPVPTGIEHGTVTVVAHGRPYEVTSLRRDVTSDGRHAVVAFGRDWAEDARRRDFTINGLFLDRGGVVHDFVGGLDDLQARRVRFIGDPVSRIREDYLRILRFFRFFAGYAAGEPDRAALHAAAAERSGLSRLSRERVRAELLKLLVQVRAAETVALMAELGLLETLIGGVPRIRRLARLSEIEQEPDAIRRLGALALFIAEDADRLRRILRLTNGEAKRLAQLAERHPELASDLPEPEQRAALYRLKPDIFRDRALMAWSDSGAPPDDEGWRRLASLPERWIAPVFPIGGAQLLARGIPKGPQLGRALRRLEDRWIEAGFPEDGAWIEEELGRIAV